MKQSELDQMVLDTAQALAEVAPSLRVAYATKVFTQELLDLVNVKFKPIHEKYQPGTFQMFEDWFKGILKENLPINSSGSFFTALNDDHIFYYLSETHDLIYKELK